MNNHHYHDEVLVDEERAMEIDKSHLKARFKNSRIAKLDAIEKSILYRMKLKDHCESR